MIYRVAIIEPSEIVQIGIKTALERFDNIEIAAIINDANRLEERLISLRINIIIINPTLIAHHSRGQISLSLPENTINIAVSYHHMESVIYDQFSAVIDIFDPISRIEEKIKEAIENHTSTEEDISSREQSDLSEREKDILVAAVKGQTNKEISQAFNISIHTVISHRKNVTRKTGIKSLSGLTVYALLNNLVNPSEIK